MSKKISIGKDARSSIFEGIAKVESALSPTYGPVGQNVVLKSKGGNPKIVNDGYTIAKEIKLKDELEDAGARLLIEACTKTNDTVGDGTTSVAIITKAIIDQARKYLEKGDSGVLIRKSLEEGLRRVKVELDSMAKEVSTNSDLQRVATISSGNKEVGVLIAKAFEEVGRDGVITVEESKTFGLNLRVVEGYQFDKGYISPYFVTNQERMETVLEDVRILCLSKKLNVLQDLIPLIESVVREDSSLLLIAEDVEGEALSTLVVNAMRRILKVVAVKAPSFGSYQKEYLEDIAILTGGTVCSDEVGIPLKDIKLEHLGRAKRVVVTRENTTIVTEYSETEAVKERCSSIKSLMKNTDVKYELDKFKERLAKLSNGVAVIEVGAATELELQEQKLRIEDALNATRAAIEEGIVHGGGYTYLKLSEAYKGLTKEVYEIAYESILVDALKAPYLKLLETAEMSDNETLPISKIIEDKLMFDPVDRKYYPVINCDVFDPAKVIRVVLENAVSIACMFITTGVAVIDEEEENNEGLSR